MKTTESRWPPMAAVVAALMLPVLAQNDTTRAAEGCHALLTERECHTYIGQVEQAGSPKKRAELEASYVSLLKERSRLCPSQHESKHERTGYPAAAENGNRKIWM